MPNGLFDSSDEEDRLGEESEQQQNNNNDMEQFMFDDNSMNWVAKGSNVEKEALEEGADRDEDLFNSNTADLAMNVPNFSFSENPSQL